VKEQKDLLKIFRSLKCIKKIHQNDHALHRTRLPASKMRFLVKKTHRIKVLDIEDELTGFKESPGRLDLWLKYGRGLQSVNYQFVAQRLALRTSMASFRRQIQQSLRLLPKHHRLEILKIRLAKSNPEVLESLLEFQRYPPSLKTFAIYQQKAADPQQWSEDRVVSAFSRLKSLESLTLSGPDLLQIAEVLLKKVPVLLNMKKLNVQGFEVKFFGPTFDLSKCQTLQNLRHLKIANIDESNETLLSVLAKPPQLESLDITAVVGPHGLLLITEFISLFNKSLKSLKIGITYAYEAQTQEKIKNLFSKISQLELLTSFKFIIKNMAMSFAHSKVTLSPEILKDLRGLFSKPVKLESFEWEIPGISGPGIILDLLKSLEGSCSTLRKLKILHPFVDLEKSQELWICNFIRNLKSIEILYLAGFKIMEGSFWMNLVDCLQGLKLLRYLRIGDVTEGFEERWFTKPLKKIAQKKGLEILAIDSSYRPGMDEGEDIEEKEEQPIYLEEVMKVNPALRKVSENVRALFNTAGLE